LGTHASIDEELRNQNDLTTINEEEGGLPRLDIASILKKGKGHRPENDKQGLGLTPTPDKGKKKEQKGKWGDIISRAKWQSKASLVSEKAKLRQ